MWLNRKVKKAIKKRNKKWKLYCNTRNDTNYIKYKECRNLVVKELKKARKAFELKLAADVKKNPKSFYRYVRSQTKSKDRVGPLKDSAGNIIQDDRRVCELLNGFFASVFTNEDIQSIPEEDEVFIEDSSQILSGMLITSNDVFNKIMVIKGWKSTW